MSSWIGSRGGPSCRNKGRARGFTLLEVIVAFTILSVALIGLLQAFATGMRGLGAAQASATAVMHARSKLDEIGEIIPLEDGELSGEYDDGYRWEVRITGVEDNDAGGLEALALSFDVEVTVTGTRGNAFTLNTLRLGAVK
jgi:general secretion pathway protein I